MQKKEHEAYLVLLNIIPKHFNIIHTKGHQDYFKKSEDLIIPEQIHITADLIATSKAKPPVNISLPTDPFSIYVNCTYTHIHFQKRIHE